ncbi:MAG: Fe-S cluster assembly scaffold protein NifU [Desulfobacteraceae bacterium]|nr:Fe-S cluster assembly scaffold protein NifU [Desulfobacteraceae bacterium]
MYSEKVMDHFSNPRNVGTIERADGIGEVGNPTCGDMMTFNIKVEDNKLTDVKFKTFGCVAAIAVSSMVSDMAKGKTLDEAKAITKKAVADSLDGLPKEKMHCSNLGAQALAEAIKDYERSKLGKPAASEADVSQEGDEAQQEEEDIACQKCEAINPINAEFCMSCGKKLRS